MHNIPEENIQYGILLQQKIKPDYKFTLYTDDENGSLKIDLYSDIFSRDEKFVNPHAFTYNKKTGKLTYDSIQLEDPIAKFDENQELESIEPVETDHSGNKKLFEHEHWDYEDEKKNLEEKKQCKDSQPSLVTFGLVSYVLMPVTKD